MATALVAAKCTNCGANLEVDAANDAAVCKYCGAAFVVEKAINNYNIANAQITAQTVNVNIGGGDFVIEGGVLKKYRGNSAQVFIPDTVKEIDCHAFDGCICVTEIVIPSTLKKLGELGCPVFSGCTNLTKITLPDGIRVADKAFMDCLNISNIDMGGDVFVVYNLDGSGLKASNNIGKVDNLLGIRAIFDILARDIRDKRPLFINGVSIATNQQSLINSTNNRNRRFYMGFGTIVVIIIAVIFVVVKLSS